MTMPLSRVDAPVHYADWQYYSGQGYPVGQEGRYLQEFGPSLCDTAFCSALSIQCRGC